MKKNKFCLLFALAAIALVFSACIFESDDDGLESWLSDQGVPSSYKVQTLDIDGLKVSSAEVFLDTRPRTANTLAIFGHASNLTHDLVLDFAFKPDSSFMKAYKANDTAGVDLVIYWLKDFYKSKYYPKDSLPYNDEVEVSVSWLLDVSSHEEFVDSIYDIPDTVWYKSLSKWKKPTVADTVFEMKMKAGDEFIAVSLPSALVESLKSIPKNKSARLQLRMSAPEAPRVYRFLGSGTNYPPLLAMRGDSIYWPAPIRMANIVINDEECTECPILHGGVYDSLVIELPSEKILKALSDFYGDEFPYTKGDRNDVRQTVIHAQLTMPRDDSKGSTELGLPIQVVVGSYVDSAVSDSIATIRRMERYRLNNEVILESGHQNLVFHEGDSLTVQLTYGARDFINKASDGRTMKFIMRMGYPFLQEKDTAYTNYRTKNGDTSYVHLSYFDYARYDFSTAMESPMSLKLWLASKRGDEE